MTTVSVVITTRNRARLLRQAIKSVRDQTWPSTELIVVDEASEDDTPHVLDDLRCHIDECVVHDRALGPSLARRAGVHASSGSYVLFLDDDDLLHPGHVEALVQAVANLPAHRLPSTGWRRFQITQDGVDLKPVVRCPPVWKAPEAISATLGQDPGCLIWGPSVLWPREIFEEVPWDEELFTNGDVDFYGRVLLAGYQFAGISEGMAYYRSHSGASVSGTQSDRSVVSSAKFRLKWSHLLRNHPYREELAPAVKDELMRILLLLYSHGGLPEWVERVEKEYAHWGAAYHLPQPPQNRLKRGATEWILKLGGPRAVGKLMRVANFIRSQTESSYSTSNEQTLSYSSLMRQLTRDEFMEASAKQEDKV